MPFKNDELFHTRKRKDRATQQRFLTTLLLGAVIE